MQIRVVGANTLDGPDGTPEHRAGKVFNLVSEAAVITPTIETEGKQAGGLYAFAEVQ